MATTENTTTQTDDQKKAERLAWFQNFINENMEHNHVEAKILNKIYRALAAAGTPITKVWDSEEWTEVTTLRSLQEIVFNLDECFLYTENGSWVRFILGNEWDVICDYTLSLEDALQPVNDYIDKHN